MSSSWTDALDALDEWVRRTAAGVSALPPASPVVPPSMPSEALPVDLQLRAQVLIAAMRDLELEVVKRRTRLTHRQAYGAA